MPPYSQESTLAQQQQQSSSLPDAAAAVAPRPPGRNVATGVVNLGNTCYMNAVLQALAHCPELAMAMDMEPHSATCPIGRPKSTSPSPEGGRTATRKSARSSGKKSRSPSPDEGSSFCALCELEHHLQQVHSTTEPVAPSAFVHGFITHVAPWFKLGVQEDSHEFLRLLMDAMQKSCIRARPHKTDEDTEYPFQLFRGTVESKVQCESCQASSSTIDPIEDIGLDVSAKTTTTTSSLSYGKVTPPPNALADVSSAFSKFKAEEILEGYKCEKCNKVGKATKSSRLASIPPILTLHLKRFRYGTSAAEGEGTAARRRSEISQLLCSSSRDAAASSGKSGSAKIEGHVKFEQFFDLQPFLTPTLQEAHMSMFCRLFAVIVHAGTNSHSGHYIAYVRNIDKNEWWKMDDARVSRVAAEEVLAAEAYMLFYRAVEHATIVRLREQHLAWKQQVETTTTTTATTTEPNKQTSTAAKASDKKRKRELTLEFCSGEDWALEMLRMPPAVFRSWIHRAQELIADRTDLTPEYFARIEEAAKKERGAPASVGGTFVDTLAQMFFSVLDLSGAGRPHFALFLFRF